MANRIRKVSDEGWVVPYGVPGLLASVGVGLVIAGPAYFWYGIVVTAFGCTWLARGWHHTHRHQGAWYSLGPSIVGLGVCFCILGWLAVRHAPLSVDAGLLDGEYPAGTDVNGISWSPVYRDVRVHLTDKSDEDYMDVNIVVMSDKSIADIGTDDSLGGGCTKSNSSPEFGMSGAVAAVPPTRMLGGRVWRIHCDKIAKRDTLELTLAALPIGDGNPLPKVFPQNSPPEWLALRVNYEGLLRNHQKFFKKCFQQSCDDLPAISDIDWDATNVGFYFRAVNIPPPPTPSANTPAPVSARQATSEPNNDNRPSSISVSSSASHDQPDISLKDSSCNAVNSAGATVCSGDDRAKRWSGMSKNEKAEMAAALRSSASEAIAIYCVNADCMDLANDLFDVFHQGKWTPNKPRMGGGLGIDGIVGIRVDACKQAADEIQSIIEAKTSLKVDTVEEGACATEPAIIVGLKPYEPH